MNLITKAKKYLCPPGNGVYTVNTAKEKKDSLHKVIYGEDLDIEKAWHSDLEKLKDHQGPVILGICSDTGGGILRGANWGPLFLREALYAKSKNINSLDLGDIRVIPHLLHDKYLNTKTIANCRKALYGSEDVELPVSPLSITEDFLNCFYLNNSNPVFAIGGDHSVSYPLVKSYIQAKRNQNKKVAIIHFDAHTDLLTERLGIDICFGSWCPHIIPQLESPAHLIQIGIRSSGQSKEHWEKKFGIKQYWSQEVKEQGAQNIAEKIVLELKSQVDELYVSFDIDAIDSTYASATGTPEKNGLDPHEAAIIIKHLANNFPVTGADMVEIAPYLNTNPQSLVKEPYNTITTATDLSTILLEAINKNL